MARTLSPGRGTRTGRRPANGARPQPARKTSGTALYVALGLLGLALVLTAAIYFPLVPGGLVSDDWSILYVSDAHTLGEALKLFDPSSSWFYRPIQKTVFFASLRLFGTSGLPLHAFFLGLHLINGVLLWRFAVSLKAPFAGVAGAALFLLSWRLHEAVGWAAAGSEILAGLFI